MLHWWRTGTVLVGEILGLQVRGLRKLFVGTRGGHSPKPPDGKYGIKQNAYWTARCLYPSPYCLEVVFLFKLEVQNENDTARIKAVTKMRLFIVVASRL